MPAKLVGRGRRRSLVDPTSPSAEAFRTLRLAIEHRPQTMRRKALLFTSPAPGDGKSVLAANYASTVARDRARVLLLDADLSRPTMHLTFQLPRSPGLSEVLGGELSITEATRRVPVAETLHVVTAGEKMARSGDFLASIEMGNLLDAVRDSYDLVVIDSPPVLGPSDTSGLASQPAVEVVVVSQGSGKRRPLVRALRKLELVNADVLGLVVNQVGGIASYEYRY